jgi:methionyl-tRNA formyltransferase
MGTPEFAVASLDALVKSRHEVLAVVTAPDRPASRGLKLQQSAVKEYALQHDLPVLQPEKLKDESFINELKKLNPDLIVVVAFRMLPEVVWKLPKYGTINLHASLLPNYRGAAPINWAIINGEEITGVTTFFINQVIDKGNVLMCKQVNIDEDDNAGSLHDKLMSGGADLLIQTVDSIADDNHSKGTSQDNLERDYSLEQLKPAPKIFKADCKIDWNKPAKEVRNFIRGLSPYPAAWTEIANKEGKKLVMKIFASEVKPDIVLPPGKLNVVDSIHIYIGCKDVAVEITKLQLEGRKTMPVADFLRGFRLEEEGYSIKM